MKMMTNQMTAAMARKTKRIQAVRVQELKVNKKLCAAL